MIMMMISGGVDSCNGGGQWHSDILLLGKVLIMKIKIIVIISMMRMTMTMMIIITMVRDGEEGYPGDVLYNVRYSLDDQGGVRIDFTGVEENDDGDDNGDDHASDDDDHHDRDDCKHNHQHPFFFQAQ